MWDKQLLIITALRVIITLFCIINLTVFGIKLYICRKENLKLRISNIIVCFLLGTMLFLMFGINNSMSMKNEREILEILSAVKIADKALTFCNSQWISVDNSLGEYTRDVKYGNAKEHDFYRATIILNKFSSSDDAEFAYKENFLYEQKWIHGRRNIKMYKLDDGTECMLSDLNLRRIWFYAMMPSVYDGHIVCTKDNYVVTIHYYCGNLFYSIPVKPNRKTLMKNIENTIMDTLINPVETDDNYEDLLE